MWRPGHVWQQQMTIYLSLAVGHEIITSSGMAPAGPQPRKRKLDNTKGTYTTHKQVWGRREECSMDIIKHTVCDGYWSFLNGIIKVLWKNPAKKSPKKIWKKSLYVISNCKLEISLHLLSPLLIFWLFYFACEPLYQNVAFGLTYIEKTASCHRKTKSCVEQ